MSHIIMCVREAFICVLIRHLYQTLPFKLRFFFTVLVLRFSSYARSNVLYLFQMKWPLVSASKPKIIKQNMFNMSEDVKR